MQRLLFLVLILIVLTPLIRFRSAVDVFNAGKHEDAKEIMVQAIQGRIQRATEEELREWLFEGQPLTLQSENTPDIARRTWQEAVIELTLQQFDPDAVVAILAGDDGQPGVAGIDDNGNGVTDDRSELGATHSDDRCETMSGELAKNITPRPLILQRGAFVPVDSLKSLLNGAEQRLEVLIELEGTPFSFLMTKQTFFPIGQRT